MIFAAARAARKLAPQEYQAAPRPFQISRHVRDQEFLSTTPSSSPHGDILSVGAAAERAVARNGKIRGCAL